MSDHPRCGSSSASATATPLATRSPPGRVRRRIGAPAAHAVRRLDAAVARGAALRRPARSRAVRAERCGRPKIAGEASAPSARAGPGRPMYCQPHRAAAPEAAALAQREHARDNPGPLCDDERRPAAAAQPSAWRRRPIFRIMPVPRRRLSGIANLNLEREVRRTAGIAENGARPTQIP